MKSAHPAGLLSLPVTLVILLIAFGALFAACIPLLLALTSVIATMFLIALPSHLMPVDAQVKEVILLIGLAVGVDYSLFYLKREREERAAGRSESAALEAAAATSGRSVLISGFTVMIAMAGMFLAGDPGFSSFALGTIMVAAIAMLGSLMVLPALSRSSATESTRVGSSGSTGFSATTARAASGAGSSIACSRARACPRSLQEVLLSR